MERRKKRRSAAGIDKAAFSATAGTNAGTPTVSIRPITDKCVLDQGRVYSEANYQTTPMADKGTVDASRIAKMIRMGTALPRGLTEATSKRMATSSRTLDSFTNGANPGGKAAEVTAISDYRAMHAGHETGIVNPPDYIATNVHDIRVAADGASRKDLVFGFESESGEVVWKYNGQVKTGDATYVCDTLVKMAKTPGYGKVGYVDSRYVNADGTPRVAPDAFTLGHARKLQAAKVRLRGIPHLEKRSADLMKNIQAGEADGLDPVARQQLQQLRTDIVAAYNPRGIIGRIGGSAATGAASAAVVSLIVQLATEGKMDIKIVGEAAGNGAAFGAASTAADSALYHIGNRVLGMAPDVAKDSAGKGVSIGFCLVAVATDVLSEVRTARRGDVTTEGAIAGSAMKIALDLLPLVIATLGVVGIPLLIGAQIGGRLLISKVREADRLVEHTVAEDLARAGNLICAAKNLAAQCDATDELFNSVMGISAPPPPPVLHLIKS